MTTYQRQDRGDRSDYERYLAGMDASMQQKVALTAAHLLGEGRVADMGMGSGTGSEALAALYPTLRVIGVDINPEVVKLARERYSLPNLEFRVGDISANCFEPDSLDVIFDSSVLHHVTTFNGYDHEQAKVAIFHQVAQLKTEGSLIIRDFLRPQPGRVRLELPASEASLLRRFSAEFRALLPTDKRGFPLHELGLCQDGWQAFELESVHAVEFILRKDYIEDWDTEVLEEYTYFTQSEFERVLAKQGLRILASTPLWNPWIVNNRFEGKFRWFSERGDPMEFPPTNYLIVGEKVPPSAGVRFRAAQPAQPGTYLKFDHYRNESNGQLRDLVRRPNATLDVVPYFVERGELYVLARKSYPRPILELCDDRLDGALSTPYVTEPMVIMQQDKPLAQTVEEALWSRAGLSADQIREFDFGSPTYPSPGGLQEEVRPVYVEIEPVKQCGLSERLRSLSACQLLRAAQVGGLPDSRLELHVFELMSRLNLRAAPWIGESLEVVEQSGRVDRLEEGLTGSPARRVFRASPQSPGFLSLEARRFQELDRHDQIGQELTLEYVRPNRLSLHTVSTALLRKVSATIYLGICEDDFPCAQCFSGHSNLLVTPAWRLPEGVHGRTGMENFVRERLQEQHGLKVRDFFTLGGAYFPSPGVTPEIVYPLACDVVEEARPAQPLRWISLATLVRSFSLLRDGHLKTAVVRAARALNL